MNKKILITGVAGMIGANFAEYLIDAGYEVFGIDDLSGGFEEHIDEDVRFYLCDLTNKEKVDQIFSDVKPDYVYHFAAYAAEGLSPFIRNFNYQNNLLASVNVINSCIKYNVKKMIFTSSMAVYGAAKPPFTENVIPNPTDPYGIAKLAVEMDLKLAKEQFGLNYTIVRPHNVIFQKYQNIWDKYRNVIGIWTRQTLNGDPITIYGTGEQTRAFSDGYFILEPLKKLMWTDIDVVNIGADKHYTINEAADTFIKEVEQFIYYPKKIYLEKRHEVDHAYCDHSLAKEKLDFKDETNLHRLFHRLFDWARHQPNREVKKFNYEIEKGMYSYWK